MPASGRQTKRTWRRVTSTPVSGQAYAVRLFTGSTKRQLLGNAEGREKGKRDIALCCTTLSGTCMIGWGCSRKIEEFELPLDVLILLGRNRNTTGANLVARFLIWRTGRLFVIHGSGSRVEHVGKEHVGVPAKVAPERPIHESSLVCFFPSPDATHPVPSRVSKNTSCTLISPSCRLSLSQSADA
jgi:hypothetical protein